MMCTGLRETTRGVLRSPKAIAAFNSDRERSALQ
jgi:hypothetical protein